MPTARRTREVLATGRAVAVAVAVGSLASCSPASPAGSCGSFDAVVAASDYTSSEIGSLALGGAQSFVSFADLGKDPLLESSAGRFFWIASDQDEILEVDPSCVRAKAKYETYEPDHAGTSDPQDVAVAPDGSLWVVRFDVPSLLVLNPDGSRRTTIDLSSLDEDGNPNADAIRILDPTSDDDAAALPPSGGTSARAFVALGILDDGDPNLQSTRPSKLAEIDLSSGAILRVLTLKGRNPFGFMAQAGNLLYLADAGDWESGNAQGAGIERVDAASFTSTLLAGEAALGGHPVELAVTSSCAVVLVAGESPCNATSLFAFDPSSGAVAAPALLATDGYDLEGLAWLDGGDTLLVGDRSSTESSAECPSSRTAVPHGFPVHVFDRAGACALTERSRPIVVPQAPIGILAIH